MGAPPGTKRGQGRQTLGTQSKREPAISLSHILHNIPVIMRKKGWTVAAQFQDVWLWGRAIRLSETNEKKLDIVQIRMDWILGFARAREDLKKIIEKISKPEYWTRAEKALKEHTVPQTLAVSAAPGKTVFKTPPEGWEKSRGRDLDKWAVASVSVGDRTSFDGLQGALGRFHLYVVPVGQISLPEASSARVTIDKVGLYVRDTFDFNDVHEAATDVDDSVQLASTRLPLSQPLGFWSFTRQDVSLVPLDTSYRLISNSDYRLYRVQTGYGKDFLVYSDPGIVSLASPITRVLPVATPKEPANA